MRQASESQTILWQQTRAAFIWTRVLSIPFWALLGMLPIIFYKDLHSSTFQIALLIALKPLSALLAPYWSQSVYQRQERLVKNLVWANILRYLPFLLFPWIQSPWLIILAFMLHMILTRGAIPAWMEVFRRNIPELSRERVFAYGSALDYLGSAIFPLGLGLLMDGYQESWRWIFPATALLGLFSTIFLWRIPQLPSSVTATPQSLLTFKESFILPWKRSWELLRNRPDFFRFQIGFMLGGAGLMLMQPALPSFFVDVLKLSYTEMMLAITACKGIGFAMASPLWIRLFGRANIFSFSGYVTALAALFPFLLLGAQSQIAWLYLSYILYGIMQAGSELSWHMSGPVFSKNEDSLIYSSTNVLTVGLRGCVAPFLGTLLCAAFSPAVALFIGALFCMLATYQLQRKPVTQVA